MAAALPAVAVSARALGVSVSPSRAVPGRRSTPDLEPLRTEVARHAPDRVTEFDKDRAAATQRAKEQTSAAPLRCFAEAWAVEVEIAKRPDWQERLRRLDQRIGQGGTLDDARAIAAEVSQIRTAAARTAGVVRI